MRHKSYDYGHRFMGRNPKIPSRGTINILLMHLMGECVLYLLLIFWCCCCWCCLVGLNWSGMSPALTDLDLHSRSFAPHLIPPPSMINKDNSTLADGQLDSLCTSLLVLRRGFTYLTTMDDLLCVYHLFSDEAKRVGISPSGQHNLLLSNDDGTHL